MSVIHPESPGPGGRRIKPTLTEFLLERIAEDEADLRVGGSYMDPFNPPRLLSECEAKRRIVDEHERYLALHLSGDVNVNRTYVATLYWAIRCLGLPYADHPDYRQEWAP